MADAPQVQLANDEAVQAHLAELDHMVLHSIVHDSGASWDIGFVS